MVYQSSECMKQQSSPEISWMQETVQMLCKEGSRNIFRSRRPQRVLANFTNRGNSNFEVKIVTKNCTEPLTRKVRAGAPFVEEFEQVTSIELIPSPTDNQPETAVLILDSLFFYAEELTQPFPTLVWFLPTACVENEVSRQPDSSTDCLWVPDLIWQSGIRRNISLEIEATGNHDLRVELEGPVGIFDVFNVSAAPALPQFRKLTGDFEGIVSVRVQCEKSPVNSCSACTYKSGGVTCKLKSLLGSNFSR
ncbi:hypothetical protein BJP36_24365 [Moorena producens JHB]|uniref:Uncharacterized protein n=1 Tax=Moorena producens (strain JHB) TaxID=1454205 RepID=A0A1D9G4R9_MOOP1|nr:hypothetical protein [Moorena producens]AOY82583.1 hypothetical protein BJP36_24365 [Moorena producens JHB]